MDKPQKPILPDKESAKNWMLYSAMAFEMFATIGASTALGFFLDKKLHSAPILVIVFLFIGLIIAFYRIYKQLVS